MMIEPTLSSEQDESPFLMEKPGWTDLMGHVLRNREALIQRIFSGERLTHLLLQLLAINAIIMAIYGGIMGLGGTGFAQLFTSALKLPMLYLFSLAVCFPLLFVVNVLMGSRVKFQQTFTMILVAITLSSLILAACAPIAIFFMITGSQYDFLKLMHVGILGFSGLWAMAGLYRAIQHMCDESSIYPKQALKILLIWMMIFGFVGTQMAWTLRPYLGAPGLQYEFVRKSGEGNFYQAIWQSMKTL